MKNLSTKILVTIMMFFPFIAIAQTTHIVEVVGNYYSPSNLTISSGDVVNWVSEGGYHDVNFASNSITGESLIIQQRFLPFHLKVQGNGLHNF